jgi:hypothetical protein
VVESAAVTVKVNVPVVELVPDRTPALLRVRLAGGLPAVTAKV